MTDDLPGYIFNTRLRYYRGIASKRPVKPDELLRLVQDVLQAVEQRLSCYSLKFYEQQLDPAYYAAIAARELTNLHLQLRALGAGGFERLSQQDYSASERRVRDDINRLLALIAGLLTAGTTMSLAQFLARLHMYIGSARVEYWEGRRGQPYTPSRAGLVMLERRILTPAEHCNSCLDLYELGWQPERVLPLPGDDSECMTNCRCILVSQEVPYAEVDQWIGTKA